MKKFVEIDIIECEVIPNEVDKIIALSNGLQIGLMANSIIGNTLLSESKIEGPIPSSPTKE